MRAVVLKAALAVILVGAAVRAGDAKKDQEALQGTWKVNTVEERGQSKPDNDNHSVVIKGDEFTIKRGEQLFIKAKMKIDASKTPKHIDLEIVEDPKNRDVGKTVQGIYSLEGDQWRWCATEPGNEGRPTAFSTEAGTKHFLITFKKDKS